jgi:hypothetical protein
MLLDPFAGIEQRVRVQRTLDRAMERVRVGAELLPDELCLQSPTPCSPEAVPPRPGLRRAVALLVDAVVRRSAR